MKRNLVLCLVLCFGLSGTSASARGGMGGGMGSMGGLGSFHPMGSTGFGGGSLGTSPYAPGTNSLGTALPSSGTGKASKEPPLGTSPAIDHEEAKVEKMLGSICSGC